MDGRDAQTRRMLDGDFDISLFYSEENPASHVYQVSYMLFEDVFVGKFDGKSAEQARKFFEYAVAVKKFIGCLTDSERKYADIVTPARIEEVSAESGLPAEFIRAHLDFYINAREHIRRSIAEKGEIGCVKDYNARFDDFVRSSGKAAQRNIAGMPTLPHEKSPSPGNPGYLAYHAPRFRFVVNLAVRTLPKCAERVLDVGPSPLTDLLRKSLTCPVDTLGLEPEDKSCGTAVHYHADLNNPGKLPAGLPKYDLVVFAEVLEHLNASPSQVLSALAGLLRPGGALILQTPNAASLPKRLKLLFGRNPYETIRTDRMNPGHVREYTLRELKRFAAGEGFAVEGVWRRFYFDARFAHHADGSCRYRPFAGGIKNLAWRCLPPFLREGITLLLTLQR